MPSPDAYGRREPATEEDVRRVTCHTFSEVGASGKPGAVQGAEAVLID